MSQNKLIIGIETSALLCSIAWYHAGKILLEYNVEQKNQHAQLLPDLTERGFKYLGVEKKDVDLVAVASGPGSFTGLRIGMSFAKGFCYGLDCRLIAVSNFELMTAFLQNKTESVHALIDAGRGKIYHAFMDEKTNIPMHTEVVSWTQLLEQLTENTIIVKENRLVIPEEVNIRIPVFTVRITAAHACMVGSLKSINDSPQNLDEVEPFYLQKFAGMA